MIALYPGVTPPAYATPRDPTRATRGARAAALSGLLGAPLMPHQRWIIDVASEVGTEPDTWRYKLVIVTLPRQSGKTTIVRAKKLDRALAKPARQCLYTAQTGKDARKKWREWTEVITARQSPLRPFARLRLSAGDSSLTFPNASFLAPFAPTPDGVHGFTPHDIDVDECWSFSEEEGAALMAALDPAQITLPDRQLWLLSTMGDASSTWWHSLIDAGRASVTDPTSTTAYFEWSADEALADADPYSPDTLAFHPALGHTQTLEALLEAAGKEFMTPDLWRRSYLNLRTRTRVTVVQLAVWDRCAGADDHPPPLSDCWISYAAARDRSGAAIWAAHRLPSGWPCLHHIASRPGTAWVAKTAAQLTRVAGTVADRGPETRAVTAELDTLTGRPPDVLTDTDRATAHAWFLGRIKDETIRHDADPGLRAALAALVLQPGLGFDPVKSAGPIDHAEAAAIAAWRSVHTPAGIPIA